MTASTQTERNRRDYERHRDVRIAKTTLDRQKKQAVIWGLKAARGCEVCGEADPRVLEFAHRDRSSKLATLRGAHTNKSLSKLGEQALREELAKCRVLCANCHRRETFIENGWRDYSSD